MQFFFAQKRHNSINTTVVQIKKPPSRRKAVPIIESKQPIRRGGTEAYENHFHNSGRGCIIILFPIHS